MNGVGWDDEHIPLFGDVAEIVNVKFGTALGHCNQFDLPVLMGDDGIASPKKTGAVDCQRNGFVPCFEFILKHS